MSTAGYSGKPVWEKLGLKEHSAVLLHKAPTGYPGMLGNCPFELFQPVAAHYDFIHYFCTDGRELPGELSSLQEKLQPAGMMWVSWDKALAKKGGVNENMVRDAALSLKLVDVKVCAVSEQWSGLKLVIRKEYR
jgi:hypothetical protein